MKRFVIAVIFVAAHLALAEKPPAAESPMPTSETPKPPLNEAQNLLESGEYEKAREAYQAIADASQADVALRARAELGAVECLDAVGRYDEALALAQRTLESAPESFGAHYWLGRLHETTGRKAKAIETYRWFEPRVQVGARPADAEALTYAAKGLDRYSILTGKVKTFASFILHQLLQTVYDTVDPKYWPARVASGDLLLAKYNQKEARDDFLKALEINPRCADAEVGLAQVELEDWQWEKCESRIARALRKNPNHVGALVTQAEMLLTERRDDEAVAELQKALTINPNSLEALSLMAAIHTRRRDEAKAGEFMARIEKLNPEYGLLHSVIGDWLSAQRQFKDAEKFYQRAIEISPELADPQTNLGRMYMETGEVEKARLALDASFRIDPYNVRTFNTLNLLDEEEKFQRVETEHFIIKFDGKKDSALARYFSEYLESVYPELTKKYGYEPPVKSIIEIFPTHDRFAVRITAMPWLHTVGACTGRVIAMDAPRKDARLTPFDWKDVLRHEFTHVITLTGTDNRIAHWFTEGLATSEQPLPLEWEMRNIFVFAVRRGELFPVAKLDWGFIRPRKNTDRALAYAEAEQICEFIVETYGQGKILMLLAAYRAGKTQADAFLDVFGQTESKFDAEFVAWARKRIESWGFTPDPLRDAAKIRRDIEANPNDPKLLGELAEALLLDDKVNEARRLATKCLEADPQNARALAVTARLLAENQKWNDAKPILERLQKANPKSLVAARALGQLALKKNRLDEAIEQFSRLTKLCSYDPEGHKGLVEGYTRQGKLDLALTPMLALEKGNTTDLLLPQKISATYKRLGKLDEAIAALEDAMRLDPYDLLLHQKLAVLYLEQRNFPAAVRELQVNCDLQPTAADHFARLANAYKQAGDRDNALVAAHKAVAIDPESAAAKSTLESLEKSGDESAPKPSVR